MHPATSPDGQDVCPGSPFPPRADGPHRPAAGRTEGLAMACTPDTGIDAADESSGAVTAAI